jgi:hypothetical protein
VVIADVNPAASGDSLALGKHRHRGVVPVQPLGGEDVSLDTPEKRPKRRASCADLVGELCSGVQF